MQNAHENYLQQPLTLTLDTMQSLHESMMSEIGRDSHQTSKHKSVGTHFKMLARYLRMQSMEMKW